MFGTKDVETQAEIVEKRIEKVEENIQERPKIDESTLREGTTAPAVVPPKTKRPNNVNKVQPGIIKKTPVQPRNSGTFTLSYNPGDKIEYITQPQNAGWKGIVEGKQNGNYTVKITEVLLGNAGQQYLATNNACNGGKPIGKNAINQTITVPGRCIHGK